MLKRITFALLFALYPLVVYYGIREGQLFLAALFLCTAACLQALSSPSKISWFCVIAAFFILLITGVYDTALPIKFYPVAINIAWFLFFTGSLFGTPAIERFARLHTAQLPTQAICYCRKVTIVWCLFFFINGSIALDSALNRSESWWALYNGLIAYILIAFMFVGEYVVRRILQSRGIQ